MAKRRKPGSGRKPKPDRKVLFTIRLLPHVLAELKAQAQTWQGGNGNVSAFTETLINRGLGQRAEEKRDPALKGLLYFITRLAERAGALRMLIRNEELNERIPILWRTDRTSFRAFKVGVHGLLDLLKEPPDDPLAREGRMECLEAWLGRGASKEEKKAFLETEKLGTDILLELWSRGGWSHHGRWAIESSRGSPYAQETEREVYGLTQAVRDLGLKTKDDRTKGQRQ